MNDSVRARHIAQAYLSDAREISNTRGMLGYTGQWQGQRLSVMGSGMGIPSCAIYATELARFHGVKRIVRVGTCGGVGDVALGDILLAQSASTDSRFNRLQFGGHDLSACADFELLRAAVSAATRLGIPARVAGAFSTDCFYDGDPHLVERLVRHRIVGVEMESAGLYGLALREGFRALSVLVVSDHLQRGEHMAAEQREQGLSKMVSLVLDALCANEVA